MLAEIARFYTVRHGTFRGDSMRTFALDTNCLIAIDERRPKAAARGGLDAEYRACHLHLRQADEP
jgi:hypothetical protein